MARSPIRSTPSASASFGPSPIGRGVNVGVRPKRRRNRIWTSATLVREPSSNAKDRISLIGTRLSNFTLNTGPRQAMQASETIVYPVF